jgi:hypothetical protein
MTIGTREGKPAKALPPPNSDFYELAETLDAEELATLKQVRAFMETKVATIINKYWIEDSFPFEVIPGIRELNIGGMGLQGYGCRGGRRIQRDRSTTDEKQTHRLNDLTADVGTAQ